MSPERFVVTQIAVAVPLLGLLYLIGASIGTVAATAVLGTVLSVVHYRTTYAAKA